MNTPLWEIALRATAVYCAVFLLLRIAPKRMFGEFSLADMLTLIIIGSMAKTGIVGDSKSIVEIVLLIAIVLIWDYIFNLLEYEFPFLRSVLRGRQTALIQGGRLMRGNMRREMITEDEIIASLHEKNVRDVSSVRFAYLEADGNISIIKKRRNKS